jgi:hypothetical protein
MVSDMLLSSILPWKSFLSFEAIRLAKPVLVWTRNTDSSDNYLKRYAYCIPLADESPDLYLDERVTISAERYGGDGIGLNGGGVRCGNIEKRQIKGIGPTNLAGIDADYWHSYGGASLKEALRETIWGEVFNSALPFGAITVDAIIIVSGSEVELPYPASNGNTHCPRALIVRPQFARPAHYLRATSFRPSTQFKVNNPTDTERTKAAIQSLHAGLTHILAAASGRSVIDLLTETYQRFAFQIAAARAKRLFHSALSASNIALDGRFLDFGMSSSVSDYGRIIVARGCPDAWLQHSVLAKSIYDLAFFIHKYGDETLDPAEVSVSILKAFQTTLDCRFAVEILKLTGVPEKILLDLADYELQQVFDPFQTIIKAGNSEPFKLLSPCPDYVPKMPDRMGRYHLPTCIRLAISADTRDEADSLLALELPEVNLRCEFIDSVWRLRTLYLAGKDKESADRAMDFLRLNSFRLNANIPSLYAYNLNAAIDGAIASGENLQSFILNTVSQSTQLVQDPCDGIVHINVADGTTVIGTEDSGLRCNEHKITFSAVARICPELFTLTKESR